MNMYALLIDTMTDDLDLELHKFEFLANFTRFRRFWMQKMAIRMKIAHVSDIPLTIRSIFIRVAVVASQFPNL